jgi:hypothetical protein
MVNRCAADIDVHIFTYPLQPQTDEIGWYLITNHCALRCLGVAEVARMPRGPSDFKLLNIVRAKRAAEKAGMHDATIEIDPRSGIIRLIPNGGKAQPAELNEWDGKVETA